MTTSQEESDRRGPATAEAVGPPLVQAPRPVDRFAAFAAYAERCADGVVDVSPRLLAPLERRLHVRTTLLEDHVLRRRAASEHARERFVALAVSPSAFFRGTALLYYRDHAGVDGSLPAVFSVGDVHPGNFGVMPGADGRAFFSAKHFDEACSAPFSYDVGRGGVGFWLAGQETGLGAKRLRSLVTGYAEGYLEGLEDSRDGAPERLTADNAPGVLRAAFDKATRSRRSFLDKRIDLTEPAFRAHGRIEPRPDLVEPCRRVVVDYARAVAGPPRPAPFFVVHDVAVRHDRAGAGRGPTRYWVLLDGWGPDPQECVIVEMKPTRRSALAGLVPRHGEPERSAAQQMRDTRAVLADGDPLYGIVTIEGEGYVVRERGPMSVDVDVTAFDAARLARYARVCGQALAHVHARSEVDADEGSDVDAEPADLRRTAERILSVARAPAFLGDLVEFVEPAAARVHADHRLLRDDLARGAFDGLG